MTDERHQELLRLLEEQLQDTSAVADALTRWLSEQHLTMILAIASLTECLCRGLYMSGIDNAENAKKFVIRAIDDTLDQMKQKKHESH